MGKNQDKRKTSKHRRDNYFTYWVSPYAFSCFHYCDPDDPILNPNTTDHNGKH